MTTIESDLCILGSGIAGTVLAQKIAAARPGLKITMVDAGRPFLEQENRLEHRERYLRYGENPWPHDYVEQYSVQNGESQSMAVGGWGLHWEGEAPRCSEEELRLNSLYGVAVDWPLSWEEMDKHYGEAEKFLGVSGDPSPYPEDKRSQPYPMPAFPMSSSLRQMKDWVEKSGILTNVLAYARNSRPYDGRAQCMRCDTCHPICPTGARYSPDVALRRLMTDKRVDLYANVLVRRLKLTEGSDRIESAEGVRLDRNEEPVTFRAKTFALALGKYWSPWLLLVSAQSRFPNGLANRSGLVGKHLNAWSRGWANIRTERPIFQGVHDSVHLESRAFYRCPTDQPYLRHATLFRSELPPVTLARDDGSILLGDDLMNHWKEQARGLVKVGVRFDIHGAGSGIVLDRQRTDRFGDPMPTYQLEPDEKTLERLPRMKKRFDELIARLTHAGGGSLVGEPQIPMEPRGLMQGWRLGGCRMGAKPTEGVCDSFGRSFDHENLFIVGAPTLPTPGIGGITLWLSALSLRTADQIIATA